MWIQNLWSMTLVNLIYGALAGHRSTSWAMKVAKVVEDTGSGNLWSETGRKMPDACEFPGLGFQILLLNVFKWRKVIFIWLNAQTWKHNLWLSADGIYSSRRPTNHVTGFLHLTCPFLLPEPFRKRRGCSFHRVHYPYWCPWNPMENMHVWEAFFSQRGTWFSSSLQRGFDLK